MSIRFDDFEIAAIGSGVILFADCMWLFHDIMTYGLLGSYLLVGGLFIVGHILIMYTWLVHAKRKKIEHLLIQRLLHISQNDMIRRKFKKHVKVCKRLEDEK